MWTLHGIIKMTGKARKLVEFLQHQFFGLENMEHAFLAQVRTTNVADLVEDFRIFGINSDQGLVREILGDVGRPIIEGHVNFGADGELGDLATAIRTLENWLCWQSIANSSLVQIP